MNHPILIGLVVAMATQANASSDTSICDDAALIAAQKYGVPPMVMLAIARVETGRTIAGELQPWPWAINTAGESYWFEALKEAVDFATTATQDGLSNIDIGCFQLNYRWHGDQFSSLDVASRMIAR